MSKTFTIEVDEKTAAVYEAFAKNRGMTPERAMAIAVTESRSWFEPAWFEALRAVTAG